MKIEPATIKRLINDHYFSSLEIRLKRIPLGEDSYNFLVSIGNQKFVLKWYKEIDQESIREELLAMKWLNTHGVLVPDVLHTQEGGLFVEVGKTFAVLFEYIEGDALDDTFSSAIKIARFLAEFHVKSTQYTGRFCPGRSEISRLKAFKSVCETTQGYLSVEGIQPFINDFSREMEIFETARVQIGDELNEGIIHHDLHRENFLKNAKTGQIKAILDFSEAHQGYLVFDLAVLLGYWAIDRDKANLDMEKCRQLLSAYNDNKPITKAHMRLLPHAVLLYFATDATGYILPRLRHTQSFTIAQCNMYEWFKALRQNRSWI